MVFYGNSDIGRKRQSNQDNFRVARIADDVLYCVVCDGMGGANGGNIASAIAADLFANDIGKFLAELTDEARNDADLLKKETENAIRSAVSGANRAVFDKTAENPELIGMGTTLVAAIVIGKRLFAANAGDSRLYNIYDGKIEKLTKDHSYVQHLIDIGKMTEEEAENAPIKNIITRSVGNEPDVEADIYDITLEGDGWLLLCSDGLTNYTDTGDILKIVSGRGKSTEDKVNSLIALANKNGGGDNITVVLLDYGKCRRGK